MTRAKHMYPPCRRARGAYSTTGAAAARGGHSWPVTISSTNLHAEAALELAIRNLPVLDTCLDTNVTRHSPSILELWKLQTFIEQILENLVVWILQGSRERSP